MLCLFSSKNFVLAKVGFSVAPQKFDLVIFPGDSYEGEIKLKNNSEIILPISVRVLPFGAEEETGEMQLEMLQDNDIVSWIKFENSEMILQPEELRRIKFIINVPNETTAGGYYFFVYFEPRLPAHYFEEKGGGPKIIPIVGVPFLISTTPLLLEPTAGQELEILEFSVAEKERVVFLEKSLSSISKLISSNLASIGMVKAIEKPEIFITQKIPLSFNLRIKNNDIYHLKPKGNVFIYDEFGKKIAQGELKSQTILPGKTRDFQIILNQENQNFINRTLDFLSLGRYRAEIKIQALSPVRGEISLIGKIPSLRFFCLKNVYFFIIFVILLIVIYLGRKRIKLALKIIFKR